MSYSTKVSFSTYTKSEMARLQVEEPCCQRVALRTLLEMNGNLVESGSRTSLVFGSENAAIARKFYQLSKTLLGCNPRITVSRRNNFKKNSVYSVRIHIDPNLMDRVHALGVRWTNGFFSIDDSVDQSVDRVTQEEGQESSQCCSKMFLRYVFLGGGSIVNPQRGYHLEITASRESVADRIVAVMESYDLKPGMIGRKQFCVVYLKEADQIAEFLGLVGAHTAMLKLESIRIIKGMRNKVNRLINCETANINKSINASLKQIENIVLIQRTIGLDCLPESLSEIAVLRLENPEASLKELGELLNPPVGKSGVNHRMRKIEKIAKEIQGGD